MKKSESGSAHVVIIGVLTIAIVAAIGTLFWQNILNKPVGNSLTPAASPSPSVIALKTYCAPKEKLCFDYPNNWTVAVASVSPDKDSIAERVTVSDESGKTWLRLETGMSGVGGACGDTDGSYSNIVETHSTKITGSYLVSPSATDYQSTTAYAVAVENYDATDKNWTVDMALYDNKADQNVGKIDPCDMGMSLLNGKNAAWSSSSNEPGAVSFGYYTGDNTGSQTYATEAAASAFLQSANAKKAFAVLQSAYYEQ